MILHKKVEAKGREKADRKAKRPSYDVLLTSTALMQMSFRQLETSRAHKMYAQQEAVDGQDVKYVFAIFLILLMQKHL